MFRKMPFILIITIFACIWLEPFMSTIFKELAYSVSISIKAIIVFLLPFIIFGLLFKTIVSLSVGTTKIVLTIFSLICISNFTSTFLSHYVGEWIYSFNLSLIKPDTTDNLKSLWQINLPVIITNDKAMLFAVAIGLATAKLAPKQGTIIAERMYTYINYLLNKFTIIIPLFIAGFIIKMQHDGIAKIILQEYTKIFLVVALSQYLYIFLAYFLLNKAVFKNFIKNITSMIVPALSAFTTMSSAASMPLTIKAVENNTIHKNLTKSVIPATVNVHLVGDCFAIPIFAYAILKSFGIAQPDLMTYLQFTFFFIFAKFSVAAVPGGGIIVMLPILQQRLGFNAEMLAIITALYILFDPVITCANVLGNGAFAKLFDLLFNKYKKYYE